MTLFWEALKGAENEVVSLLTANVDAQLARAKQATTDDVINVSDVPTSVDGTDTDALNYLLAAITPADPLNGKTGYIWRRAFVDPTSARVGTLWDGIMLEPATTWATDSDLAEGNLYHVWVHGAGGGGSSGACNVTQPPGGGVGGGGGLDEGWYARATLVQQLPIAIVGGLGGLGGQSTTVAGATPQACVRGAQGTGSRFGSLRYGGGGGGAGGQLTAASGGAANQVARGGSGGSCGGDGNNGGNLNAGPAIVAGAPASLVGSNAVPGYGAVGACADSAAGGSSFASESGGASGPPGAAAGGTGDGAGSCRGGASGGRGGWCQNAAGNPPQPSGAGALSGAFPVVRGGGAPSVPGSTTNGIDATDGADGVICLHGGGGGAGGGAYGSSLINVNRRGGNGGNGGFPGGSGAGGGAAIGGGGASSNTSSGLGGRGGDGVVVVTAYF